MYTHARCTFSKHVNRGLDMYSNSVVVAFSAPVFENFCGPINGCLDMESASPLFVPFRYTIRKGRSALVSRSQFVTSPFWLYLTHLSGQWSDKQMVSNG